MASEHITRAYDEELRRLSNTVAEMGGLAESQLGTAIEAVMTRDTELAARVVEGDVKVDQLERELDNLAIRLLALRQPVARDLREIFSALKIASDLERIGDYAANVAKRRGGDGESVELLAEFCDELHFFESEDLAGGVVGGVDDDGARKISRLGDFYHSAC